MENTLLSLTAQQQEKLHIMSKKFALAQLPYSFGVEVDLKKSPEQCVADHQAFDCSELVEYLYRQIGLIVPDGARFQRAVACKLEPSVAAIGDLVFKEKKGMTNHVGMVMSINPIVIVEANGWEKVYKVVLTSFEKFSHTLPGASQYVGLYRFFASKVGAMGARG